MWFEPGQPWGSYQPYSSHIPSGTSTVPEAPLGSTDKSQGPVQADFRS